MNKLRLSFLAVMFTVLGIIGAKAQSAETNFLSVPSDLAGLPGTELEIPVSLTNDEQIVAFQFDMIFPEGTITPVVEEDGDELYPVVEFVGRNGRSHTINAKDMGKGVLRVLAYSDKNVAFTGNEGELISILVTLPEATGTYTVTMVGTENGPEISTKTGAKIVTEPITFDVVVALPPIENLDQYNADEEALNEAKDAYEEVLGLVTDEYNAYRDETEEANIAANIQAVEAELADALAKAEQDREYIQPEDFDQKIAYIKNIAEAYRDATVAKHDEVFDTIVAEFTPYMEALIEAEDDLDQFAADWDGHLDADQTAELNNIKEEIETLNGTLESESLEAVATANADAKAPDNEVRALVVKVATYIEDTKKAVAYAIVEDYEEALNRIFFDIKETIPDTWAGYYTEEAYETLVYEAEYAAGEMTAIYEAALEGEFPENTDNLAADVRHLQTAVEQFVDACAAEKLAIETAKYDADKKKLDEVKETVENGLAWLNEEYPAYVDAEQEDLLKQMLDEDTQALADAKAALDANGTYTTITSKIDMLAEAYDAYEYDVLALVDEVMEAAEKAADPQFAQVDELEALINATVEECGEYANAKTAAELTAKAAALRTDINAAIDAAIAARVEYDGTVIAEAIETLTAEVDAFVTASKAAYANRPIVNGEQMDTDWEAIQEVGTYWRNMKVYIHENYPAYVNEAKEEAINAEIDALDANYVTASDEALTTREYVSPDVEATAANIKDHIDGYFKSILDKANDVYKAAEVAANADRQKVEEAIAKIEEANEKYNGALEANVKVLQGEAYDINTLIDQAFHKACDDNAAYAGPEELIQELVNYVDMTIATYEGTQNLTADKAAIAALHANADEIFASLNETYAAFVNVDDENAIKRDIEKVEENIANNEETPNLYTSQADSIQDIKAKLDAYELAVLDKANDAYEAAYDASLPDRNRVDAIEEDLTAAAEKYAGYYSQEDLDALLAQVVKTRDEVVDAFNKAADTGEAYVGPTAAIDALEAAVAEFIAKADASGIKLTIADDMRVVNSTLYNAGEENVAVYTVNGTLVYAGNDRVVNLPGKGTYIVKVGNKAIKANVR